MKLIPACFALLLSIMVYSCNDDKYRLDDQEFQTTRLTELMPLYTGKYIVYRLDSILTTNLGRTITLRHYRIKDEVAEPVTDNLGRPGYKVIRYITDSAGTAAWTPMTTYFITPLQDRVEVVENNFRIIKLRIPVKINASWKGNSYLPFSAYGHYSDQRFNEVNAWEFTYTNLGKDIIGNKVLDSVWTVRHFNEVADTTIVPETMLYGIGYAEEKYAKNIGLVAKELIMLENEPNQIDENTFAPYKLGFGIRMWMIEHN